MRIKSLKIVDKAYKNLDITLDDNTSGIMAFIGNNGSGKSNVLEAISIIFKYLYQKKDKEIPFDFSLTYEIGGGNLVEITKSKTTVITKINGTQNQTHIIIYPNKWLPYTAVRKTGFGVTIMSHCIRTL